MNGIDTVRHALIGSQKRNTKYKRLRYITFTGTQYIDTGVIPDDTTEMIVSFKCAKRETMFIAGSRLKYGSDMFSIAENFGGSEGILLQYADTVFNSYIYNPSYGTYNVIYLAKNNSTLNSIDVGVDFNSLTSTFPIYLGAVNQNNQVEGRNLQGNIYDLKLFKNGKMIRHFIPVMYQTGEIGFQELIEDKLYLNDGTGDLIAGPEHDGQTYIPLDYISSTGAGEYIDTKIKGIHGMSFELECAINEQPNTTYRFTSGLLETGIVRLNPLMMDRDLDVLSYVPTIDLNPLPYTDTFDTDFHTYIYNEVGTGNIKFDGNIVDQYVAPEPIVLSSLSIFIFARNALFTSLYYPTSMKIRRFKLWDQNGILVASYQPVYHIDSDKIGMYDTIKNTLMLNRGKGAFIPGPQLPFIINDLI